MGSSSLSGPTNRCLDFRGRKINKPIDDLVRLNSVERGPAEPVNIGQWQMWYMHRTENPTKIVQLGSVQHAKIP